ncbi:flagellar motor switch protein FliG [Pistricoccus aurantiacus]|uniref:flagellar motor switch protein FliG n=1 Tax=Pistricoccus aurantiacus TaxID=1883414 RepID=UPI003632ACC4
MPDATTLSGLRRGTILLLSLDEDSAARVFRFFSGQEIEKLSREMTNLGQVGSRDIRKVLKDFRQATEEFTSVNVNSSDHVRAILTKALGSERAAGLIDDVLSESGNSLGIDALNVMEPNMVSEMIREEHPQIIATILVHLQRHQAARVLELLEDKLRDDVVLRIATFSGVQPEALKELTEVLGSMLEGQNVKRSKVGGVRTAAEILNLMNTAQEEGVIETVRGHNEDLAQRIIDEMFVFENLLDLEDRAIQMLLKETDTSVLCVALKSANQNMIDKFTRNMSQRAAQLLMEDMDARGPMRVSQVEEEQKKLLQIVRRLADNGDIVIGGGDEEYV